MKRGRKTRHLRSSDRSVDVPDQAAAELPSSPLAELDQSGLRRSRPPVRHLEPLAQETEDENGDGLHHGVQPDDERASPGEGPAAQTPCPMKARPLSAPQMITFNCGLCGSVCKPLAYDRAMP
ncbi:hypothetical protein BN1708_000235 [Verticillium longisporum]|uniref:Uncharacterized protein n=1 Tax=Verticillium longisporum TaxID=100787 RepID=A0A0G4KD40_VERLO|nr:hypothetical protein BN1708_000235 [Verticillium longisporum]